MRIFWNSRGEKESEIFCINFWSHEDVYCAYKGTFFEYEAENGGSFRDTYDAKFLDFIIGVKLVIDNNSCGSNRYLGHVRSIDFIEEIDSHEEYSENPESIRAEEKTHNNQCQNECNGNHIPLFSSLKSSLKSPSISRSIHRIRDYR